MDSKDRSVGRRIPLLFLIADGVQVADPSSYTFFGCCRMASGIEVPEEWKVITIVLSRSTSWAGALVYLLFGSQKEFRRCMVYTPAEYETKVKNVIRYFTCNMAWARMRRAGRHRDVCNILWIT